MSNTLEVTIMWTPWLMGMATASLTAYYANNFVATDVDYAKGSMVGDSGYAILGTSAASIAVQAWAVLEWWKYMIKKEEGKLMTHNRNANYAIAMKVFWSLMMIFYLVEITSCALNVRLVTHFSNLDVVVKNKQLNGPYGDAVEGMSYTVIALGGISFIMYLFAELATRHPDEKHVITIETHGGY